MRLGLFPMGAGKRGGRPPLPTAREDACEEAAGSGAGSPPTVQPLSPTPVALEDAITGLRAGTPRPLLLTVLFFYHPQPLSVPSGLHPVCPRPFSPSPLP